MPGILAACAKRIAMYLTSIKRKYTEHATAKGIIAAII